ncbi:MAG: FtsX-like permease family protein [Spirochaetia bacterium]|nr:FtsX-like permease family protein [Spirochaetia bacterium]
MGVIFRIALRNLREHKSKTLIIGIIIAVGIMIMTIGTSLIDTATTGIEKAFIENYTGDILIGGIAENDLSIFGVQSVGGIDPTPRIPEYARILEYLDSRNDIEIYTPEVTGFAAISVEGQKDPDSRGMTLLFGIEPDSYRKMFERITILEGEFLKPGESGILLTQGNRKIIEKRLELTINVGDSILLTGFSDTGIKIREVEVKGFYRLLSETEGVNMSSYIDIPTLRALKAINAGGSNEIVLNASQTALLDADNFDDLFSNDAFSDSFAISETNAFNDPLAMTDESSETEDSAFLDPFAGSSTKNTDLLLTESEIPAGKSDMEPSPANSLTVSPLNDSGSYEFILLSLKNQRRTNRVVDDLNKWFIEEGIAAQAMDWKGAAGPFSSTADVIRNIFNVAVLLVAFVALIIITNTLLISVMERKKEIGTMRAMGARKGFVSAMFTTEIVLITLVFGIIGELLGLGALGIVSLINIKAGNTLVEVLFAGPVLHPVIHISTLAIDLAVVIAIGILANLYPVFVALRIQPVKAISSI